jgi:heterotetrameric sarcosine oxidase gamma subunit
MSNFRPHLAPRSAFADQLANHRQRISIAHSLDTPAITLNDRSGLGLATLLARKGKAAELAQQLHKQLSMELPAGPRRTTAGDLAIIGVGPGTWLATHEQAGYDLAASIRHIAGDLASVSDQTDGYAVLRLSGPKVRDVLCKLVPVDVHSQAFEVGNVAVTLASQVGATLWRLDDETDGSPVFELAVYRSYAASIWYALSTSAAEFNGPKV